MTDRYDFREFGCHLGNVGYELSGMISDMRVLMTGLSRLADRLESDPTQFFFGSSEQGFEAE